MDYKRQEKMNIDTDITPCVVGAGGAGFNACLMLAMAGVKSIYIFDPDVFEEHNLNRIPVPYKCIGMSKTETLKSILKQMRPEMDVTVFKTKFNSTIFSEFFITNIIDCSDNYSDQKEIYGFAKENSITYCKLGYNGERMSIDNKVAMWDVKEEDNQGYTITPSWAVPSMMVAALGVAKVLKYKEAEISFNLKDVFEKTKVSKK
jgi:molybdopterin/thiamine biosynthesis adenylyltransferase